MHAAAPVNETQHERVMHLAAVSRDERSQPKSRNEGDGICPLRTHGRHVGPRIRIPVVAKGRPEHQQETEQKDVDLVRVW